MSRSLSKMRRMSVNAIRVVLGSALKLPLLRCQVSWLQKMSQPQLPVYQSAIRSREPSYQGQHRLPQPASSLQLGGKSRREKMDSLCVCHRDVFCAWAGQRSVPRGRQTVAEGISSVPGRAVGMGRGWRPRYCPDI
ncbi:uncharacterized protein LOC117603039 isoform X3 [Osmia lignaria lignaria]|uniref:uncharacterized protein LOC117603039 isoform X3 n=1 Tax=Osmia lignaria lignaria TaxID=1437193 RepID=UPI00402BF306